jgi:DNA repair ATPase RecN
MQKKNNPFIVPDNYFEDLNNRLLEKSAKKHVSSPKMLKYVASISAVIALGVISWIVMFQNPDTELKKNESFAFLFNGFKNEKELLAEQIQAEQEAWNATKQEIKLSAEQVEFTEDEYQYIEYLFEESEDYSMELYANL